MPDDDHDNRPGRILRIVPRPPTPGPSVVEILEFAMEEAREYPKKHCIMVMFDDDGNPSFWGTEMNRAELSQAALEMQLHATEALLSELLE